MKHLFDQMEASFRAALRGEENINTLIYRWGVASYILAFLINKIIYAMKIYVIGALVSVILIAYFVWHIYALKKCSPKKPKLTKEEKAKLRAEQRKELPRKIMRKLLLQESVSKSNPVFVTMVIDAFCIAEFLDYIIR